MDTNIDGDTRTSYPLGSDASLSPIGCIAKLHSTLYKFQGGLVKHATQLQVNLAVRKRTDHISF
jgi:hypothetical protein